MTRRAWMSLPPRGPTNLTFRHYLFSVVIVGGVGVGVGGGVDGVGGGDCGGESRKGSF